MNRKEFLEKIGIGAAFVLTASCLGGCSKNEPLTDVDFTLNLTDSTNSSLLNNGGYLIQDKVVVAKNDNGDFVAATQICSHENKSKIILKNDEWFCTDHDARFDLTGNGLNDKGSKGLLIYNTDLDGDLLRVFS